MTQDERIEAGRLGSCDAQSSRLKSGRGKRIGLSFKREKYYRINLWRYRRIKL